jgi:hypothetical protein
MACSANTPAEVGDGGLLGEIRGWRDPFRQLESDPAVVSISLPKRLGVTR